MTVGLAVLLPMLLLAGCGAFDPYPRTPEGDCARAADQDPEVRAVSDQKLLAQAYGPQDAPGGPNNLRRAKIEACLTARGQAPRGGVQKVLQ